MEGSGCGVILVLVVVGVVVWNAWKAMECADARKAYQGALSRLKANPANADLRQETLGLGRIYSNKTRNNRGVTVFDEVALMNDINAACAGAGAPALESRSEPAAPSRQNMEGRLSLLVSLKAQGLIEESEYLERRKQILDEI